MTTKLSAEEKAIFDYLESGRAVSIANLENEKKRYAQIAATQMSKKKSHQHPSAGKRFGTHQGEIFKPGFSVSKVD